LGVRFASGNSFDQDTRNQCNNYATNFRDGTLEERIKKIEPALEETIRKKVGKYEPPPKLLVYLNMVDHGRAERSVEEAIARQKVKHSNAFNGIHVIWKAKLY
jgi:hypothetical protein